MDVKTITMDTRFAAVEFKAYRKKVREHKAQRIAAARVTMEDGATKLRHGWRTKSLIEKEDETLMHSYRVMAQGQRIINVESVIRNAGRNKQQLPNLAIGRADWKEAFLLWRNDKFQFSNERHGEWYDGRLHGYRNGTVDVPLSVLGAEVQNQQWRKDNGHPTLPVHAIMPSVPVHLRPAGNLSGYYILWEADWKPAPPVDPLLLKHVHGPIYVVLAQWDLTPIERAVLEGRIT
jgi:hypothetical protein